MDLQLSGKHVLVSGGASGIGLATAKLLFAEGASVTIVDLADDVAAVAGQHLQDSSCGQHCDITAIDSVKKCVARAIDLRGPISHFVHAAAIGSGVFGFPFTNLSSDDWRRVMEVNIIGTVETATFISDGIPASGGAMVMVSSVAGQIGSQTDPPYSASKAAMINFAQCMAKDLAPRGIRVNTVCPGMVKTPLNQQVWESWNRQQPTDQQKDYESWAQEKIRALVPLARWQRAEDVANMIVFLLSDRASEVTGQTINVDGGFVMHW